MQEKHKSKLHKGFIKQVQRQYDKPRGLKIKLPVAIELPKNFKGKYKHSFTVSNSIWNGMNLICLCNSFNIVRVGGMYGKFSINTDGKYILSRHGKDLLRRKHLNRKTNI